MAPTEMTMDMHMFGTMYAISNKWTLMGMLNYLDNEMTMPMGHGEMDSKKFWYRRFKNGRTLRSCTMG